MQIFLAPGMLYVVAILGMLLHFMKKNIKGETPTEIKNYFKDHFKSTFIAFAGTTIAYLAYYFVSIELKSKPDIIAVFGLGYMFDSFFNKYDTPTAGGQE